MDNALHAQADRLALLYRLSQTFNSSLDLDQVLNRVMDEVIAATRAERGFVMLRQDDGNLSFRVARGIDHAVIHDPQFQISRGIVERVAREGQALLTSDALHDDRISQRHSVLFLGLRSVLCVPLKLQDRITGVVYVDNRLKAGLFSPDDLDLLSAIAASAAIAIENARLYQLAVEQGRMERELQMARDVQASLLPQQTPHLPGWDLAARWIPAREVSGDYYDFLPGDGDEPFGLVIADVSDKGMPAALFMALTRSVVRASLGHAPSPAEGMARANRLLCADASGGMFVTLFYGQLEPSLGQMTYVNAGHNPPLLCRSGDAGAEEPLTTLMPTGVALGIVDDWPFEQQQVHLDPGDLLLLYTDGVTDATGPDGQRFGMDRLRQTLLEQRHAPAAAIVAAVERAVGKFAGEAIQFDDIALLAVKRLGTGA